MTYVVWDGLRMGAGPVTVEQIPRVGEHVIYMGYEYKVDSVTHDYPSGCVRIGVITVRRR